MKLRQLREEIGLSQKELAKILGVSPSNIYNYETGRTEPSIEWLIKLADVLRVSIDELLGHDETGTGVTIYPTPALSNQEKRLLNSFRILEERRKEQIIDDVEYYASKSKIKV